MQNITFNNSSYVIKPPQPSTTLHGAPPFTRYPSATKVLGSNLTLLTFVLFFSLLFFRLTFYVYGLVLG